MARLTAPLLSLDARGQIGKALVFSGWKGIKYARQYVIPANPQSVAQMEVRGIFSTLNELWKRMEGYGRYPFWLAAVGNPLTDRNVFVRESLSLLIDQADLDLLVLSVAGGNALNLANIVTADGADGTVAVTADAPTAPSGYTLLGSRGVAVLDGDPSPVIVRTGYFAEAAAAPWAFAIDVPADGTYQVGVYAFWKRDADGQQFTSIADRTQVAVTGN